VSIQSNGSVVQSAVELKCWMKQTPSVEEVRPSHCPGCGLSSRPVGEGLLLHGHGTRERQVRGPLEPDGEPQLVVIEVRRYLCRGCGLAMTVVPRATVHKRLYSAAAIALALALWTLAQMPEATVRERISPWKVISPTNAPVMWTTLKRWARAIRHRRLFPSLKPAPPDWTLRRVAERAAMGLSARAPPSPGETLWAQAFAGAAHAA
jgi:ferredoxin